MLFPFPEACFGLEAVSVAGGTLGVASELREKDPDVHLIDLGFEPAEEAVYSIPLVISFFVVVFSMENKCGLSG